MIGAYLINLDRSRERLAHMDGAFKRIGVAYERIAAIDGRADDFEMPPASEMSRSEVAAYLSHRLVWEIVARRPQPYAAVFEDDVYLAPALASFLSNWAWIPAGVEVIKIDTMLMSVNVEKRGLAIGGGFHLRRLLSTHWGTGGYIVSTKAAAKLAALPCVPTRPADAVLFEFGNRISNELIIHQLDPALCVQHDTIVGSLQSGSPLASVVEVDRGVRKAARRSKKTPVARIVSEASKARDALMRFVAGRAVRKKIPFAGADRPTAGVSAG